MKHHPTRRLALLGSLALASPLRGGPPPTDKLDRPSADTPLLNERADLVYSMVSQPAPRFPGRIKTVANLSGYPADFTAESASKPYSIASAGPGVAGSSGGMKFLASSIPVSLDRFQIKRNDQDPYTGGQRSEWDGGDLYRNPSGHIRRYPNGTVLWLSYSILLLPDPADGLVGLSDFNILGQLHQSPGPGSIDANPMISVNLSTNYVGGYRFSPSLYYSNQLPMTRFGTNVVPYTHQQSVNAGLDAFAIGQWHSIVQQFKMDPIGMNGGFWKFWHNGVPFINYSGPIGYASDVGSYFKFGIYGNFGGGWTGTSTIAWYGNVEFGTDDLTDRIANALATPPPSLLY
jgi:hypothetical protein